MIHFCIGTKAQLIKMLPVIVELKKRGVEYRYVDAGQHANFTKTLRKTFNLREPEYYLKSSDTDITTVFQAIIWSVRIVLISIFARNKVKKEIFPGGGICLVHGDTPSTLLGLILAKTAGLKVVHIEAGLRSFNMFHPFPEELIRIYCMKRCDLLFAPSDIAYENLQKMKVKGEVVKVEGNTVVDSLRLMKDVPTTVRIPQVPYVLAACHRLETITQRKKLQKVVKLLNETAKNIKVVFVTHKPTRKYLEKFGLLDKLSDDIEIMGMQDYMNFTALMKSAKMVMADGGSIQEECAYLNKPCLILRHKTERPDGIGKNAVLWNFDEKNAAEFMQTYKEYNTLQDVFDVNPSKEIIDVLVSKNIT